MTNFLFAMLLLLGSPGPGVLTLAGVGSAFGYRAGWAYGAGLFVGSNMVMAVAAGGLAALFLANESLRLVFTLLSTAYLLYLAAKIAFAGSKLAFIGADKAPGFWGGITLQAINPKAYAVGTFVFSNFPMFPNQLWLEIAVKFVLLNAVWIPIHVLWLAAGVAVNSLDLRPAVQRGINIAMALAMLVVVGLALASNFSG